MCSIYFSIFSMPKNMHITHTHSLWLTTYTHNLLIITHIHAQHDHHYITHIYTLYTHQLRWGRGRRGCWHTARVNDGGEAGGVQYVLHTNAKINCLSSLVNGTTVMLVLSCIFENLRILKLHTHFYEASTMLSTISLLHQAPFLQVLEIKVWWYLVECSYYLITTQWYCM